MDIGADPLEFLVSLYKHVSNLLICCRCLLPGGVGCAPLSLVSFAEVTLEGAGPRQGPALRAATMRQNWTGTTQFPLQDSIVRCLSHLHLPPTAHIAHVTRDLVCASRCEQ
jgi:hypothetical protein